MSRVARSRIDQPKLKSNPGRASRMATKQEPALEHASLGHIAGVRPPHHPQVEQYLGIQYATLANRFARGTLIEKPPAPIEATDVGPLPVADPKNCDNEHRLFQHALPHPEYKFSDTECLTLNVSVPSGSRKSQGTAASPLPVVVFMHGGGFVTGSANWPQYDLAALVERSEKLGSPVVAVGINYRLGPFGFLTSSAMRDAGFKPNNGLDDQKLGLRWVQKHISGFGGDPGKVTFLGSSIGAASGFYHLQSTEPLFNQLVALGGSPLIHPLPAGVAEVAFGIVTNALGLEKVQPAEQVKALLEIPAAELSAKLSKTPFPLAAVIDDDIVKSTPTFARLADTASIEKLFPGIKWCKTLMIGDSQVDGMIMGITALANRPDNLASSLKKCLEAVFPDDGPKVTAILNGYGIDESKDDKMAVLDFVNDIAFAQGARAAAQAWAGPATRLGSKAYLAHFNIPNPWDGPWKGHATHALDVALVLGNYNEFLGEGQKACAEKMAADLLSLAHGQEPFPAYSGAQDGKSMVYYAGTGSKKDESYVVSDSDESKTGRRAILDEVAAGNPDVLDKLLGVFALFIQGPR